MTSCSSAISNSRKQRVFYFQPSTTKKRGRACARGRHISRSNRIDNIHNIDECHYASHLKAVVERIELSKSIAPPQRLLRIIRLVIIINILSINN
nr:MAG TPA: hypothetical protein [Caudoviricetes sp.]